VKLLAPAAFLATHVYAPTWSALVDSIERELIFLPILLMTTSSLLLISALLKSHAIVMGESPFVTVHCRDMASPALIGSSPAAKGIICGKTGTKVLIQKRKLMVI
jgi:hypothetical protein